MFWHTKQRVVAICIIAEAGMLLVTQQISAHDDTKVTIEFIGTIHIC